MKVYKMFLEQGVRLRMMALVVGVLCALYALTAVGASVSKAVKDRNIAYDTAITEYEQTVTLWNWYASESSEAEAIEKLGDKPTEPTDPGVDFSTIYGGIIQLFLISIVGVFMCSVLVFYSNISIGAFNLYQSKQQEADSQANEAQDEVVQNQEDIDINR